MMTGMISVPSSVEATAEGSSPRRPSWRFSCLTRPRRGPQLDGYVRKSMEIYDAREIIYI